MKDLIKDIACLRDQGYEIRFPGGNGIFHNNTHASFGVVVKEIEGKKYVLVIPYKTERKNRNTSTSFNEDPKVTLRRKLKEETGVEIDMFSVQFISELKVQDNRLNNQKKSVHIKRAFLSKKFDDQRIREYEILGSHLGIPFWMPVEMLEEHIAPTHSWIVTALKGIEEFRLVPAKKLSFFQRFLKKDFFH